MKQDEMIENKYYHAERMVDHFVNAFNITEVDAIDIVENGFDLMYIGYIPTHIAIIIDELRATYNC